MPYLEASPAEKMQQIPHPAKDDAEPLKVFQECARRPWIPKHAEKEDADNEQQTFQPRFFLPQ